MSSSNAAAIRRRAGAAAQVPPAPQNSPANNQPNSNQMTIEQVLKTMSSRIKTLEQQITGMGNIPNTNNNNISDSISNDISNIVEEFNNRFELLVTEMNTIKDTVLKLQTYTMEVNKTLYEDRVKILSDLETPLQHSEPKTLSIDDVSGLLPIDDNEILED